MPTRPDKPYQVVETIIGGKCAEAHYCNWELGLVVENVTKDRYKNERVCGIIRDGVCGCNRGEIM